MHLDDDHVQRLVDGELAPGDAARARAHVETCAECGTLVAGAARESAEIASLLHTLDDEPPQASADAIARHARATSAPDWRRRAAGVIVALALAGGAYAFVAPGSPVRAWVVALVSPRAPEPGAPPASPPRAENAGIAVAPGASFVIVIPAVHRGARAVVTLTDEAALSIRAESGTATFTSATGRAIVMLRGSAVLDVRIPRGAPHVEIVLGRRSVLRADAGRVHAPAAEEVDGTYTLSLAP
jgi:anti-sigma factor RsiW